jgi:hypothetical protein
MLMNALAVEVIDIFRVINVINVRLASSILRAQGVGDVFQNAPQVIEAVLLVTQIM